VETCAVWGKFFDHHPVHIDFPRVCRQMVLFDRDINVITKKDFPDPLEGVDESTLDETTINKLTLKKTKQLICLICQQLLDFKLIAQVQKLSDKEDTEAQLKALFSSLPETNKVLRFLKLTHHLILVTPYLILKKKFAEAGFVLKEQSGVWSIQVVFKADEIHILHEKKSASGNDAPEEKFEFVWNLQIITDTDISQIKNVKLTLSELEINPKVPEDKKSKIRSIISLFMFH